MHPLIALTLLASQAAPEVPQLPRATQPDALRIPMDAPAERLYLEDDVERGRAAARGLRYIADFDGASFRYRPLVTMPEGIDPLLTLTLERIEIGGESFAAAASEARLDGASLVAERGPVVERYVASLDSIEQTFVFEEPLQGSIAVEVGIDCELERTLRKDGVTFAHGSEGTHVSHAFAVDADGWRLPLDIDHNEGGYRIEVPAAFVDAARFPLTIDPVISTFTVDDYTAELRSPRIAWDSMTDTYLAIYEEITPTYHRSYWRHFDASGTILDESYFSLSTTDSIVSTDVVAGEGNGTFLIGGIRREGPGPEFEVISLLKSVGPAATGPVRRMDSGGTAGPFFNLSMGRGAYGWFVMAWQHEKAALDNDILARIVSPDGTLPPGVNIAVDTSSANSSRPRVPETAGPFDAMHSSWPIVYQVGSNISSSSVACTELAASGAILRPSYTIANQGFDAHIASCFDGPGPRRFLVAYQTNFSNQYDVRGLILEGGQASPGSLIVDSGVPGFGTADDEWIDALDCDGESACMVWRDEANTQNRVFVSTIGVDGTAIRTSEDVLVSEGFQLNITDVARAGGASDYALAYEFNDPGPDWDVGAMLYDSAGPPVGTRFCQAGAPDSTGFPGHLQIQGSGAAGDPLVLAAQDLPQNTFGFFVVATNPISPVVPPGSQGRLCIGGTLGRFVSQIQNSGTEGRFQIEVDTNALPFTPTVTVAPGDFYCFQGWYRDLNPTPTSNFTDAILVMFE